MPSLRNRLGTELKAVIAVEGTGLTAERLARNSDLSARVARHAETPAGVATTIAMIFTPLQ